MAPHRELLRPAVGAFTPYVLPRFNPVQVESLMKLLIAVDGSDAGPALVRQAVAALPPAAVDLILVSVLPPPIITVTSPTPVVTTAAITAALATREAQARADEATAREALGAATHAAVNAGVPEGKITSHVLPAAGGASGVGESLVEFARAGRVDLVAVGSRGLGSLQRSLYSLVGLGSVSDYAAHNLPVPLLVLRTPHPAAGAAPTANTTNGADADHDEANGVSKRRTIILAIDESSHSTAAIDWVKHHLLTGQSKASPAAPVEIRCVTVAPPVPYPALLDEASAAAAVAEAQDWAAGAERDRAHALDVAKKAAEAVSAGGVVPSGAVIAEVLAPQGGASEAGAAVVAYAHRHKADLVVVGSRGLGSFKRGLMSLVGLGSVSDYVLHHLSCPVLVVKEHHQTHITAEDEKTQ